MILCLKEQPYNMSAPLKIRVRNWILSNHPEWYAMRIYWRTRNFKTKFNRTYSELGLPESLDQKKVLGGVFKGVNYTVDAIWSEKYPKVLGTYEKELFPFIESLEADRYDQIINVGAAEGFFGTALSVKLNVKELIFVDPLKESHKFSTQLAADNGLKVSDSLFWISPSKLNKIIGKKKTLLFLDCEGAEAAYLDPTLVPNLANCDVIAETHDFLINNLADSRKQMNEKTHEVVKIQQQKRTLADLSHIDADIIEQVEEEKWLELMNEKRPKNLFWLVMKSKSLV